ncbi:MAG: DUF5803 family protein [Halobacteriales archaeon]|nr:DUF5803 family protein [Halobacteriales archaeon]
MTERSSRRRLLAAFGLVALMVTAGCSAFGGGSVDQETLDEEITYDWNTTADATIEIERNRYKAVYRVQNRSIELYRFHRLNNKRSINPAGVKFRYPNGTIVGPAAMDFEKTRSTTTITLPAENGTLAFAAPKQGKRVRIPAVIDGSYEVILPPNTLAKYFLLGRIRPDGYERSVVDNQVHLQWEEVPIDRIVVEYYLQRDLLILSGLVAGAIIAAIGGVAYFWLQLRELRSTREDVALDVDTGDE